MTGETLVVRVDAAPVNGGKHVEMRIECQHAGKVMTCRSQVDATHHFSILEKWTDSTLRKWLGELGARVFSEHAHGEVAAANERARRMRETAGESGGRSGGCCGQ